MNSRSIIPQAVAVGLSILGVCGVGAQTNHALNRPATASSHYDLTRYPASHGLDGDLSDDKRWLGVASGSANTFEVLLDGMQSLRQAHIYSGYESQNTSPIDSFTFERWDGAAWQAIAGSVVSGDDYFATTYNFDSVVTTNRLRMVITDTDVVRLRDLALWTDATNLYHGMTGDNLPLWIQQGFENYALGKPANASSTEGADEAQLAVDGVIADTSRWSSAIGTGEWLEIHLGASATLAEAHVYNALSSGGQSDFHLEWWNGSVWQLITGSAVTASASSEHRLSFSAAITTDRIRVVNDNAAVDDTGRLRIQEIALWNQTLPLFTGMTGSGIVDPTSSSIPIIAVNQIGYQTDASKRFTAPLAVDGTAFELVAESAPTTPLFNGTITDGLGDFSTFQPSNPGPYQVRYTQGGASTVSSYPFLIQGDLIESKLVGPCIQFMVDSRSGVGTHPSAYGGAPWRDGEYYSFEIPSLIYLHLNARSTSNSSTTELDYNTDKAVALDPNYASSVFVGTKQDSGFVTALQSYYTTYDPPLADCPDALKTVHFGLGVTMERPNTKDPSGDPLPEQLHAQTKEWFAWFLYAWPDIRHHFPDSFYEQCRDFTFANWATSSGLGDGTVTNNKPSPLDIDELWDPASYGGHDKHPFKGRHPLGHSILPNLLLWQVALREERSDAAVYLAAAQAQTSWVITNIDWNDPKTTKGMRMSEHKLMPGLVYFLRNHPTEAPVGLATKIEEWANIMISRSDNLWDFRRYELVDTDNDGVVDWSLPRTTYKWNEPGNLAGFPACALAAAWTLDHAPVKQARLREMSQAAIDCLFGRNPLNTGSASRPSLGFPDQETSWTPLWTGGAGFLDNVRGALASGPGSEHFPYNPDGAKRHHEGWVNFNASLNMGLSYMLADRTTEKAPLTAPFPLVFGEIHAAPTEAPLAEFVEIYNPTTEPVRLLGLTLAGDVTFTMPAATQDLAAGDRCLIVRDLTAFENTYGAGLPVVGTYSGDLNDAGAVLKLGDVNGNVFASIDVSSLPDSQGHSRTNGLMGWRVSADTGGSPGTSDSIPFTGDPDGDSDHDSVPNLVHHAVVGIDRDYIPPTVDLDGTDPIVTVTRNLAADDTSLKLEWSLDLGTWYDAGAPVTETPSGDRLSLWSFEMLGVSDKWFFRLNAEQ